MFDDPKKELNRLDAELRAEAYEDQLEALQNQEIPELDDLLDEDLFPDADDDFQEEPLQRTPRGAPHNDAVDFSRTVFTEAPLDDNSAVFVEKRKKPQKQGQQSRKQEKKKKEGVGCLPFVIALELMGIAGMLWWWYRWMR